MQFLSNVKLEDMSDKSETESEQSLSTRMRYRKIYKSKVRVREDCKKHEDNIQNLRTDTIVNNISDVLWKDETNIDVSNENDSERLFALSLVQPMQSIPESQRFTVRLEIMKIIQQALLTNSEETQYRLFE